MGTQFFDLDINAKLPIIREDSLENPFLNGVAESNKHHSQQNGLTNYHHDGDNHHQNSHNRNNHLNQHQDSRKTINNNNSINNNNHNQQLDLPKPSFRLAQNYDYRRRTHTMKSKKLNRECYYHYDEPKAESLLGQVEYDMDDEDAAWLESFNAKQGQAYNYHVSENDFERIMDRLEKESYFESKRSGKEILPEIDEDALCAICNDGDSYNANAIIFCDMCDLAVHQECYGVPYVPEGQWHCRRCLQSPSRNVDCVLCPNKGGAFKQTDDNRWAHVICALWIPEVCFANTVFLEPIDSINQIPAARWKLNCYICKQKKIGACIQCHKPNCYAPFHVTCAQQAGLYMKIKTCKYETPEGSLTDVKKEAFCDAHGPSDGANKGGGMYSGDETDDEDVDTQAYKKWKQAKRENMKKTRKILAEKRAKAFNPIAEPRVEESKLVEISKLLTLRGRRKMPQQFEDLRLDFIRRIEGYWIMKRAKRNGVPLLRRLQVSYKDSLNKSANSQDLDKDKYTRLRYDLEKARLLVGQVKRRENLKKKMFDVSRLIVEMRFQIIDSENPPTED